MSRTLEFEAEWSALQNGSPEEKACFAEIGIRYGSEWLTEVDDRFVKRTRAAAPLSGYHLAEWLAWNWWRLRWEPQKAGVDWACAHRLTAAGGGYVWPNIVIASDGQRIRLNARPTAHNPLEPFRYIADMAVVVRAGEFEGAVDSFLEQVLEQLRMEDLPDTNFSRIWRAVREERTDPTATLWRKLEAAMGFDPDAGDAAAIEGLVAAAASWGEESAAELAAAGAAGSPLSRNDLNEAAGRLGAACDPSSVIRLDGKALLNLPRAGDEPAWRRAAAAAEALRLQENLGMTPVSDIRLADMAGVSGDIWQVQGRDKFPIGFTLDNSPSDGRVVLPSRTQTGRRFNLTRLLGDRIAGGVKEALRPATEAATYRQQFQKAFATEFLCPFKAVFDMAAGDYSSERTEEIAEHFRVSPLTIRASLANHGVIGRDGVEQGLAA